MSELYEVIERLCRRKEINMTELCRESGVSRAALSDLKMGRKKSLSTGTLRKIAAYFSVPMEYLLGMEENQAPDLSEQSGRDIAKMLDQVLAELRGTDGALLFNGEPLDDRSRELLLVSLQNQMEISKRIAGKGK